MRRTERRRAALRLRALLETETHWAFQPVRPTALPPVKDVDWVRSPVDAYVLARLEAAGISPAKRADKRTLIRRATIDLWGIPPTAEDVDRFEDDASPEAFAHLVDRLLASPRYGERWGRHWLDVARYADTKGYVFAEDRGYPYAYTYRDYVIAAFNSDLDYDQFILHQIAADQLTQDGDRRPLAAMGFLTVGRRFLMDKNEIIDDRIDVVCRGLLGLTVTCARCHDHKYDPIPTEDYYSLYGVFASSVEPAELPLLKRPEASPEFADYERKLGAARKTVDDYLAARRDEFVGGHESAILAVPDGGARPQFRAAEPPARRTRACCRPQLAVAAGRDFTVEAPPGSDVARARSGARSVACVRRATQGSVHRPRRGPARMNCSRSSNRKALPLIRWSPRRCWAALCRIWARLWRGTRRYTLSSKHAARSTRQSRRHPPRRLCRSLSGNRCASRCLGRAARWRFPLMRCG